MSRLPRNTLIRRRWLIACAPTPRRHGHRRSLAGERRPVLRARGYHRGYRRRRTHSAAPSSGMPSAPCLLRRATLQGIRLALWCGRRPVLKPTRRSYCERTDAGDSGGVRLCFRPGGNWRRGRAASRKKKRPSRLPSSVW